MSFRDTALTVKTIRQFDVSHAAIQRHEISGHFDTNAVLASQVGQISPEELTVGNITRHKVLLWWQAHKDEVPNSPEIRAWFKLLAELRESEAEVEKAKMLREMFLRPALPAPALPAEILVGEYENIEDVTVEVVERN